VQAIAARGNAAEICDWLGPNDWKLTLGNSLA
jgi:hypothetical protein